MQQPIHSSLLPPFLRRVHGRLLSFTVKRAADGSRGLWSLDHAELSVPLGPPSFARTQADVQRWDAWLGRFEMGDFTPFSPLRYPIFERDFHQGG